MNFKLTLQKAEALDEALTNLLQEESLSGEEWLALFSGNKQEAMQFAAIAENEGLITTTRIEEDPEFDIVLLYSQDKLSKKMAFGGYKQDIDNMERDKIIKDLQVINLELTNRELKQRIWKRINAIIAAIAGLAAIAEGVVLLFRCFS